MVSTLGKTIQTIGLILAVPPTGRTYTCKDDDGSPAAAAAAIVATSVDADPDPLIPSETSLRGMSGNDLKLILKRAGLPFSGKKDVLLQRCLDGISNDKLKREHFAMTVAASLSVNSSIVGRQVCTLIVCPVSVLSNWDSHMRTFVKPKVLNVQFYQGT